MLPVVNKLKEAREELGLSQEEVARIFRGDKYKRLKVTRQLVSTWERGTKPDLEYALILSEIYNKTVNELFKLA